jgi:hypothetical protein
MTYLDGRGMEWMISLSEGMAERAAELLMKK